MSAFVLRMPHVHASWSRPAGSSNPFIVSVYICLNTHDVPVLCFGFRLAKYHEGSGPLMSHHTLRTAYNLHFHILSCVAVAQRFSFKTCAALSSGQRCWLHHFHPGNCLGGIKSCLAYSGNARAFGTGFAK